LEKSIFNPFAISAGDNAFLEQEDARIRDIKKQ
jgi:hypothetical protein